MPLYDFECTACGELFEDQVSYGVLPNCPACGAGQTERLMSPFALGTSVRPRGLAAKRSNDKRRIREEARAERRELRKQQPKEGS